MYAPIKVLHWRIDCPKKLTILFRVSMELILASFYKGEVAL